MSKLFHDLELVPAYLDDILVIINTSFEERLSKLEIILQRLKEAALKGNAEKSVTELEYLGYRLTPNGSRPLANKIEAVHKSARPKNKRKFYPS